MKETGLMFKAPLIRAILSGQKTQTRRILKNQQSYDLDKCPLGQPGDRIYVRETFVQGYKVDPATGAPHDCDEEGNDVPMTTWYRATDSGISWEDGDGWETNVPWRPAIHMPKALARIWLEITSVRVERLQDISDADCIAEGIEFFNGDHECGCRNYMDKSGKDWTLNPRQAFKSLWESTGGNWHANPWVWAIDFKQIAKEPA